MKKNICIATIMSAFMLPCLAQTENSAVRNGNKLYKSNNFEQSLTEYQKAISIKPDNPVANYNLGNAQFRTNHLEEAVNSYETTINTSKEKTVREKAFYNKGVAFSKQQKLQESIDAWKNALKLDATDKEARENLQKALLEKKKQQPKEDEKKENKEKKKDEDKDKKQDKDKQPQQPEQQPSKLSKKQVEQLLKALAQREKEVQQKLQSKNSSPSRQEKDW